MYYTCTIKQKQMKPQDFKFRLDETVEYCKDTHRLEVWANFNWGSDSKEGYDRQEKEIDSYTVETDTYTLFTWCDISGYDYWMVRQKESNYLSITIELKKQDYSLDEMKDIQSDIEDCISHFSSILEDFTHLYID